MEIGKTYDIFANVSLDPDLGKKGVLRQLEDTQKRFLEVTGTSLQERMWQETKAKASEPVKTNNPPNLGTKIDTFA